MISLYPLVVSASKVASVTTVAYVVTVGGALAFVVSWLWLVYQNFRFHSIHGILSLIPLWAIGYGFFRMEHARKDYWIFLFLGGIAVAMLGSLLLFSAQACERSDYCMPPRDDQSETQSVELPDEASQLPSQLLFEIES